MTKVTLTRGQWWIVAGIGLLFWLGLAVALAPDDANVLWRWFTESLIGTGYR